LHERIRKVLRSSGVRLKAAESNSSNFNPSTTSRVTFLPTHMCYYENVGTGSFANG
jgi:hypothetical protein